MKEIKEQFQKYFDQEDKQNAVLFVLDCLKSNKIDVVDLYAYVLTPVLNELKCDIDDKRICIWQEHVKTAIVRTVVENCYPYVIAKKEQLNKRLDKKVAVVCPPDEYHDIGAKMIADLFTISGFDTIFVGSGTPYQDFYNAITLIKPCMVAISVSNYFNLVAAKRMIEEIKKTVDYPVKVIVGGHAFSQDGEAKAKAISADLFAKDFDDVLKMTECGVIA